eukprot:TRINITY_DN2749_c0_g1_i1.p1 TRINITY_DN2749_c0_g1~~TRINITY_DN2749_c0_g1_i1.p1  ORF type:complete len:617 (-),score=87.56 TRINITY_DN2749_c0_g1_i1:1608-3458(-)
MAEDIILQDSPVAKYLAEVKKKPASKGSTRLNLGAELNLSEEHIPDPLAGTQQKPPKSTILREDPALEVKVTEINSDTLLQEASNRFRPADEQVNIHSTSENLEGILSHPFILPLWRLIIGPGLTTQWKRILDSIPSLRENYWRVLAETPDFILPSASVVAKSSASSPPVQPKFDRDWSALPVFCVAMSIFIAHFAIDRGSSVGLFVSIVLFSVSGVRLLFAAFLANFAAQHLETETSLRNLASQTSKFNKLFRKAIQYIQEIELVSLGFKVSNPMSPIARLERSSKARKSGLVRQAVFNALRGVSKACKGSASQSEDPLSLAALKQQHVVSTSKRFEYVANSLDNLNSIMGLYSFQRLCANLSQATDEAMVEIQTAMDVQEWTVSTSDIKAPARKQTETTAQLAEHLNGLQRHFSTLNARISLMKQTLASPVEAGEQRAQKLAELLDTFTKAKAEIDEAAKLKEGFERSFERLVSEWNQESPSIPAASISVQPLLIPEEPQDMEDTVLDPEALKSLISDAVEKVYEAFKEETVPTGSEGSLGSSKPKLTREQRIAQQKQKREQVRIRHLFLPFSNFNGRSTGTKAVIYVHVWVKRGQVRVEALQFHFFIRRSSAS